MTSVIVWIIIFLLIAVWFIIGYKICAADSNKRYNNSNESKRTEEYKKFLESTTWRKIENLEPIQNSHWEQ